MPLVWTTNDIAPFFFFRLACLSTTFVLWISDGASVQRCVAEGCRVHATGAVAGEVHPTAFWNATTW